MATGGTKPMDCKLVKVGALKLQDERLQIVYRSIAVLSEETMIIVDYTERNLRLYSCNNGKLLATSDQLSKPRDVCVLDDTGTKVAVTLDSCQIEIFTVESKGLSISIRRVWVLTVKSSLARCYGLGFLKSRQMLVVSGMKIAKDRKEYHSWGLVPLPDSEVGTYQKINISKVHKICKYGFYGYSYLATDDETSTVYITCSVDQDSPYNGVYAFDVMDGRKKFAYCRNDLHNINGISVGRRGFIYVCNRGLSCIYQLTNSLELVTVHIEGIPPQILAMCMDKHHRDLYVTSFGSAEVWRLHPEWEDQQGVPIEIMKMDDRSIKLFEEALKDGKATLHSIRIMVVGHLGVGKTTLVKRLLGEEVKISERRITEGIDVYVNCCDVSLSTHEWTRRTKDSGEDYQLQRIAEVLAEHQSMREKSTDEQAINPPEGGQTESLEESHIATTEQDIGQDISSATSQQEESPTTQQAESSSAEVQKMLTQSETNTIAMWNVLKDNVNVLEPTGKYSLMTIWDFAGQYAFYTTHQTFLTRRAIYLLVSDVSGQVTDIVADECYFDSEGVMKCKVHELTEVWLNSIHSCASSHEAGSPL